MKKLLLFYFYLCFAQITIHCQNAYFQQQVNYIIEATLDDSTNLIKGNVEMEYFNNSPEMLDKIYIHLWGNAYKNNSTAYAKQALQGNKRDFHFAEYKDRGSLSGINFTINGQEVKWQKYNGNEDIAEIILPKGLESGQNIQIKTPFTLKIPKVFSRLGHDEQNYYLTQWYPKPAVYDKTGWHPIPYLNQGEFYSEFGNYNVKISLPENYIVAATGTQQNETEISFLKQRIDLTKNILNNNALAEKWGKHASAQKYKTIEFKAERVHDFAWFASKDFLVVTDTAVLKSGTKIPTYAYFMLKNSKNWQKSSFFVKRAIEYLSENLGDYPWPQASAVDGELLAGGGMEYPMITIISSGGGEKALDEVIEHEVGHNWFYGILASNERDNPWMDEGINSFYEEAYMSNFYPKVSKPKRPKKGITIDGNMENLAAQFLQKRCLDQAVGLKSVEFAQINYGLDVYKKTARYFKILQAFLGNEKFQEAMQQYYKQWAFRHPEPSDVQRVLENSSGKDLGWLFQNMIDHNQGIDYAIKSAKNNTLEIKNKTTNEAPFPITLYKSDSVFETKWLPGFQGEKAFDLDLSDVKNIVIDANNEVSDLSFSNNYYAMHGLFKNSRPIKLKFFGLAENKKYNIVNIMPALGWNNCDKTMLGLLVSNPLLPGRNFQYYLVPMISTAGGTLVGQGKLEQNFFSHGLVERLAIGVFGKTYTNTYNSIFDYKSRYSKIAPYISVELDRLKPWSHKFSFTSNVLIKEQGSFDASGNFTGKTSNNSYIQTLDYDLTNHHALHPNSARIRLEQQSYNQKEHYVKLSLDWRSKLYYSPKKSIDVRLFAGTFIENTKRNSGSVNTDAFARGSFSLASTGADDYLFEEAYLGRSATSGFFSKQVDINDGGMKFPLAYTYGQFGYSNSFLVALNFKAGIPADMPFKLPIKPYFDLGYYADKRPINRDKTWQDNVVWAGGMMLDFSDYIGIYFPVTQSTNLTEQYKQSVGSNYLKRITFSITLPVTRISEWMKSFSF